MELRHNDINGKGEREEAKNPEEKNRKFRLFKEATESVRKACVMAVAVGATVFATACMNTVGRYSDDSDTDAQEEVTDAEDEDAIDAPDVPDVEPDEMDAPDSIDVIGDEVEGDMEEEDGPEPTCFEHPTPIDPTTDPLLNSSSSQDAYFEGPSAYEIAVDVESNVSMTGYPGMALGECPLDPSRVAFLAATGSTYTFASDISLEAGAVTWSANVPALPGITCPAFSDDSQTLVSNNDAHQAVPKNANMSGRTTHAAFDLSAVSSTLIVYEKNGVTEDNGLMTITGADFVPVHTAKTLLQDGGWDIAVEVRAGDSSANHVYSATLAGSSSKEARIYPAGSTQMYGVTWDESAQIWCSRCTEHRSFELVVPGDLICKVADACGCVGDGLSVTVLSVTLDKTGVPPHLLGLHLESSPSSRTGIGALALSDPASVHPEIRISFTRGTASDGGEVVIFRVNIVVRLESQHLRTDGTREGRNVSISVPVTDPWAWGSLEPTYTTYCLPCTLSY